MMKSDIAVAKGSDTERVPCPRDVFELESTLEKLEQELREINSNQDTLKHNFTELMEMKYLLQMAEDFFEQAECQLSVSELPSEDSITLTTSSRMARRTSSIASHTGPLKLGFVAGVIRHERFLSFEKILWRLFHGNFVLRHAEIQIQEEENNTILKKTEEYRQNVLTAAAGHIQDWSTKVRKMKAVYYTLNLCNIDITQKLIVAEIWCPVSDLASVQAALMKGSEQSGCSVNPVLNRIPTSHTPPTFNRTNAFTAAFQSIIDAYGVADYQEINPAPYTIVTFPFLFAIMFGDCGHGLVMSLLAVWVIYQEEHFRHLKNELIDVLVGGRYILLLMGLFSIYTGLIYNDCFSKSFNIFGSSWSVRPMFYPHGPWTNDTLHGNAHLQLDPAVPGVFSGSPYPFGIDPVSEGEAL
ncbi:hypothetical protein AALO_G00207670 [Alosa alosa]|uniref:V-type proton ATPase subunit a n=1 Tax=Alosa alosa TaxID=278164 RepID=A0AAV6FZ80_9TELE|nr:hypothetical protein AALO_G00207670 [Alosa alosa]